MRIKLHYKKLLVLCMCVSINSYAQSRRVADRYFNEFSYVRSAELYKDIYNEKGDDSKHVLSRLADSYYNNADVKEAEVWYSKLVEKYKDELSDAYLFKYAQVLRSTGKYKKSDSILKSLKSLPDNIVKSGMKSSEYILEHSKMKEERISVSNLAINSEYSDYGGFILDGNAYFTSSAFNTNLKQKIYDWNNQPFLNIYKAKTKVQPLDWSKKDTVLVLNEAKMISAPITTEYHEGKPVFTKDGKTMYFTRNNFDGKRVRKDKKKIVNLKVFKASLVDGIWVNVVELPFNSDEYSVGHPVLSPDEKILYFTSDMPGGEGMTDLYMVEIYAEDNYGVPKNLGDRINTRGREEFPYVGKDGTLYFSSDGHTGLGLLDIFQTKLNENSENNEVINLGEPLNSNRDDFAFFINDEGKYGFFSSNRDKGKGSDDIYSFFIYSVPPPCTNEISGHVVDSKTKTNVSYATISLLNESGEIIEEVLSDENGMYNLEKVPCDSKYTISSKKFDYEPSKRNVELSSKAIRDFDMTLDKLIVGDRIDLKPIYFDLDKYAIRDDAKYELEKLYRVMTNHPELVIRIESHTDSWGKAAYNLRLSQNRASSTREYLIERGIDRERIMSAQGFGESKLLNNCNDENQRKCSKEEHQLNRRSYFIIIDGKEAMEDRVEKERLKAMKEIQDRRAKIKKLRENK
ncbi:WD40-like Beta Propeller Repeat [Tenacibaculum sp. MAR_2009_124]|uniref:OmpA family protein n=1 Tax=Tenacibaculum sp. MAR_2009_124 TaxID=1250059 RepID=UPI00089C65C7|nr:OmpA family protein [Tenacibaculum sp. MAR_2009_124]SEC55940.1 WD40-like Beta Propeller Repeat [Tenacibaculum sp. MAR_2009_124]